MERALTPYLFALGSNVSFAFASALYADYSRRVSAEWMNFHKAFIAWLCFGLTCLIFGITYPVGSASVMLFLVSGFAGLFLGDTFLLKAFAELGSGRTLMVFGFQPLVLGAAAYLLFGDVLAPTKFLAVIFLIGCVFSFSMESSRLQGHWGTKGLLYALAGVLLDAAGLLMTKYGFELSPGISPFYVNIIRTTGALAAFFVFAIARGRTEHLFKPFWTLSARDRGIATFAGALGTFVSLSFYLHAVQLGQLASISAIAGTSPVLATIFETATGRRPLTRYLLVGALFFLLGFAILTLG